VCRVAGVGMKGTAPGMRSSQRMDDARDDGIVIRLKFRLAAARAARGCAAAPQRPRQSSLAAAASKGTAGYDRSTASGPPRVFAAASGFDLAWEWRSGSLARQCWPCSRGCEQTVCGRMRETPSSRTMEQERLMNSSRRGYVRLSRLDRWAVSRIAKGSVALSESNATVCSRWRPGWVVTGEIGKHRFGPGEGGLGRRSNTKFFRRTARMSGEGLAKRRPRYLAKDASRPPRGVTRDQEEPPEQAGKHPKPQEEPGLASGPNACNRSDYRRRMAQ